MTRTFTFTLVAAAALAGCNQGNSAEQQANDAANEATANAPVVLPPSITASKTYRCKDNSLIYIDWLSDGSAKVKKSAEDYSAPAIKIGDEGSPLTGTAEAASVTYNGQSCKA
jgi:uncharacterized lipoprotein